MAETTGKGICSITLRIPQDLKDKVKHRSLVNMRSMNAEITLLLSEALKPSQAKQTEVFTQEG